MKRHCAKCGKVIPTVSVTDGTVSVAAVRHKKGQYQGLWLCAPCGQSIQPGREAQETIYAADPKGQVLEAKPSAPQEKLPDPEKQT